MPVDIHGFLCYLHDFYSFFHFAGHIKWHHLKHLSDYSIICNPWGAPVPDYCDFGLSIMAGTSFSGMGCAFWSSGHLQQWEASVPGLWSIGKECFCLLPSRKLVALGPVFKLIYPVLHTTLVSRSCDRVWGFRVSQETFVPKMSSGQRESSFLLL